MEQGLTEEGSFVGGGQSQSEVASCAMQVLPLSLIQGQLWTQRLVWDRKMFIGLSECQLMGQGENEVIQGHILVKD